MWSSARGHQAEDKQVPQLSQTLPGLVHPRWPDPAQHPAADPSTIPTRPGSSSTPHCHVRCCGFQQCLQTPIPSPAPQHGGALGTTVTPSPRQPHGCWGQSGEKEEEEEEEEGCSCPRLSRGPTAGLDARITRLQLDPGQPQPCHRSPSCPPHQCQSPPAAPDDATTATAMPCAAAVGLWPGPQGLSPLFHTQPRPPRGTEAEAALSPQPQQRGAKRPAPGTAAKPFVPQPGWEPWASPSTARV